MTTILNKPPKSNGAIKKLDDDGYVQSVTLSLSRTPPNREYVSWSSSEGSTYYSDDEISLKKRRQTRTSHRPQEEDNAASAPVQWHHPKTSYQSSKGRSENTQKRKSIKTIMMKRWPPVTVLVNKKKALFENVESFPAIDIATNNEELSAVGFLTTEDTAAVFCTSGIPFEVIACKKIYEKISPMSSASTDDSSSDESSDDSSDSGSYEESRKRQEKREKRTAANTECGRARSESSDSDSDETLTSSVNEYAVNVVSTLKQEPVSSLESMSSSSSWDESSSDNGTSDEGSSKSYQPTLQKDRDYVEIKPNKSTSEQEDSKVNRRSLHLSSRQNTDLITDERIKKLKAKIKSIQDLSNRTHSSTESESNHTSPAPKHIQVEKIIELEHKDDNTESTEPLMIRNKSQKLQQEKETKRSDTKGHGQNVDRFLIGTSIPLMVPVGQNEDVSTLQIEGVERDIEASRFAGEVKRKRSIKTKFLSDQTKSLLSKSKAKIVVTYYRLLPIIEQKRGQFEGKPRYEQILIISISALSMLFIILLCVMISQ